MGAQRSIGPTTDRRTSPGESASTTDSARSTGATTPPPDEPNPSAPRSWRGALARQTLPDVSDSVVGRLLVGVSLALVALILEVALNNRLGDEFGALPYVLAIVLAAAVGGFWAGLLTTLITATGQALLVGAGSPGLGRSEDLARLVFLLVDGVIVSWVAAALSRARRDAEIRNRELAAAMTAARQASTEQSRLYAAEAEARRAAETAEAQSASARSALAFVADASRVLSTSLDYAVTLQRVVDLAVPAIADWCSVDLIDPAGRIRSLASAHVNPELAPVLREYRERFPPVRLLRGSAEVIASSRPMLLRELTDDLIDATSPDPEIAEYAKRLRTRSYIAVPLISAGQTIGAIALGSTTPGRFGDAELQLAEDLASRAAAAIEHSRLYRDASQFIATVDATLGAVFMYEPRNLRFTYVNQGAMAQVGLSRDQLLSMRAIDIKPDFDETSYRALIEPLLDGSQASLTFSTSHLRSDGQIVPVEVSLQCVRLPGGDARMIVTARDIRQQIEVQASLLRLARAERSRAAELSAVIQGMGEGVLEFGGDGDVVLSNPAAVRMLGESITSYSELIARLEAPAERLPALGTDGGPVELRVRGANRWLEASTYVVPVDPAEFDAPDRRPAEPEAPSTILLLRDVTAARQAQAAQEAFIGVLSHELRTPITTIYGSTKLLRRPHGASPVQLDGMLADIEDEADRLYRLVEDLLILSRAETGLLIEGEPVLLQHVVRSVLASEAARWPRTTFTEQIPPGLPPVSGDRTYLEQVVRNLLSNAAKYSPPGSIVLLTAEAAEHDVIVRVLDEGPGIVDAEADLLFQLFFRSSSTSRKASGAGIGLYVCNALIQAMGGRIWARSRAEGGSEFGFSVPMLDSDEALDDSVDESAEASLS